MLADRELERTVACRLGDWDAGGDPGRARREGARERMCARPAGGRASDIVVVFPRKRPRLERVPIAVQHPLNKPSSGSLVVVVVFVVFVVVGAVAGDDVRVGGDAGGGGARGLGGNPSPS